MVSKSTADARIAHDRWLKKNGSHPDQIKERKKKLPKITNKPSYGVAKSYFGELANTVSPPVFSNSIWEQIRTGNETQQTIDAIKEKSRRVAPAYNKGALQLIPANKEHIKVAGKKV